MDVDYLKSIGHVESFPISIDSSMRDHKAFPTPAEYDVEFESPFTNVVGFDVLDASIPNTMYVVDENNNELAFAIRVSGTGTGRSIRDYLQSLSGSTEFQAIWNDVSHTKLRLKIADSLLRIADVRTSAGSADAVLVYRMIPITQHGPGVDASQALSVDPDKRCKTVYDMGRDAYVATPDGGQPRDLPVYKIAGGSFLLVCATSVTGGTSYGLAPAFDVVDSPFGHGERTHYPVIVSGNLVGLDTYGIYTVQPSYYATISSHAHELEFRRISVEIGDHDIDSLVEALSFAIPTYDGSQSKLIELSSTSAINPANYARNKKIRFNARGQFWLDMEKSTIRDVIGFGQIAPDQSAYRIGNNLRVFESQVSGSAYYLDSPGVITLIGQRLMTLRCPQIEEHAFSSLAQGKTSAGLGVFKLYEATVAHLRFDFIKLARLNFHPIGKLSKIRIRFERLTGQLYDFKSANHHLFISVRFLVPRTDPTRHIPPDHSLNPDYDPDILRYISKRAVELDESDTDSDAEILADKGHLIRFNENRRQFLTREEMMRRGASANDSGSDSDSDSYSGSGSDSSSDSDNRGSLQQLTLPS